MLPSDAAVTTEETEEPSRDLPILAAVKGSEADASVLDWSADLAASLGLELHIIHVVENNPQPMVPHERLPEATAPMAKANTEARAILERARQRVLLRQPALVLTPIFHLGGRSAALIERSATSRLLVVGATLQSRLKRLLLGSVTLTAVQYAKCPTIVVPRDHPLRPVQHVVVGVDGSAASVRAVAFALTICAGTGAALTCVVGWNVEFVDGVMVTERDSKPWKAVQDRYAEMVHEVVDPLAAEYPGVSVSIDVRPVWPAYAVLEAADATAADLVVVGSRGLGGFRGLLLGSVGKKVLELAGRPVAIVR